MSDRSSTILRTAFALLTLAPFAAHANVDGFEEPAPALTPEMVDAMAILPGELAPLREVEVPRDNPQTPEKIELGRALFFDPVLSGNGKMSCGTCHDPKLGFADGLALSTGSGGKILDRHTPTVINCAHNKSQFWDGRAPSLEAQAVGPILAADEMNGGTEADVVARLDNAGDYRERFELVFGGAPTLDRVAKAIAAFERTLVSSSSRFDLYLGGKKDALTVEEKRGLAVFVGVGACTQCHLGPNLSDGAFHNIGMEDADLGRFAVTGRAEDRGAFRTPSLRDIAATAPYGHNGRFATLEELIEFYDRGGGKKPGKSAKMKALDLSLAEKAELAAFLRALTSLAPLAKQGHEFETLSHLMDGGLHEKFTFLSFTIWHDAPITKQKFLAIGDAAERLSELARLIPRKGGRGLEMHATRLSGFAEQIRERAKAEDASGTEKSFLRLENECDSCHAMFRADLIGNPEMLQQ